MIKALLVMLLFTCCVLARASEEQSIISQFASALGCPKAESVEAIRQHLITEWNGKSMKDVSRAVTEIIDNRGSLGAVKNANGDFFALSHKGVSLAVHLKFGFTERLVLVDVKCILSRERTEANQSLQRNAYDHPLSAYPGSPVRRG